MLFTFINEQVSVQEIYLVPRYWFAYAGYLLGSSCGSHFNMNTYPGWAWWKSNPYCNKVSLHIYPNIYLDILNITKYKTILVAGILLWHILVSVMSV